MEGLFHYEKGMRSSYILLNFADTLLHVSIKQTTHHLLLVVMLTLLTVGPAICLTSHHASTVSILFALLFKYVILIVIFSSYIVLGLTHLEACIIND